MGNTAISREEIDVQLSRILDRPNVYLVSDDQKRLIRHLVAATLDKLFDKLSGLDVVKGLLRKTNRNAASHAVGRVRGTLQSYYAAFDPGSGRMAGPGVDDSIIILIPLGEYRVTFERRERSEAQSRSSTPLSMNGPDGLVVLGTVPGDTSGPTVLDLGAPSAKSTAQAGRVVNRTTDTSWAQSYLSRLIGHSRETPSYFPERLRSGLLQMGQQVQVVTEPERFDRFRAEELERQSAAGMPDHAPLRSHPFGYDERTDEKDRLQHRILSWDKISKPESDDDKKPFQKIVVLGDPGFGKSWLLKSEAIRLACDAQDAIARGETMSTVEIPVIVRLATLARQAYADSKCDSLTTVDASIANALLVQDHYPAEEVAIVREALKNKRATILLDAWDEVGADHTIFDRLSAFAAEYPGRIVATSRGAGYRPGLLGAGAGLVEILAFQAKETNRFIELWFKDGDVNTGKDLQKKLETPGPVQGLARIPLLLSLICGTFESAKNHELPKTRGELYDIVLRGLLYEWPKYNVRPVHKRLNQFHYKNRDRPKLAKLAWTMKLRDQFDGETVDEAWGHDSADELLNKYDEAGIFVNVGDGAKMFLHRTFQEYLTAYELSRCGDCLQQVDDLSLKPKWHEVIVLLATHMNPVPIVEMLRHERDDCVTKKLLPRLALAGRVLGEGVAMDSEQIAKLRSVVFEKLVIWKAWSVNLFYSEFVRKAYRHVWRSLVSLLTIDPKLPLDLFGVQLLNATVPAVVELCVGTLKSPDVHERRAAAWALAKMGPRAGELPIAALVRVINEPDPDAIVRKAAAQALGQMGTGAGEAAIAALVRVITGSDPDADVRRAAAQALGHMGTRAGEPIISASVKALTKPDPDYQIREFAARTLGNVGVVGGEPAIAALVKVITRPDPVSFIRVAAAEALGKMGPRVGEPAIAALINMLTEPDLEDEVSSATVQTLGQMGPSTSETAVAAWVRVLIASEPDVRERIVWALGTMGPTVGEAAIAALVRVLTEPDPDAKVRSAAVEAFWRMAPDVGAPAIAALVRVLTEPDPDAVVRIFAAQALWEVGPDVGEPAVAALVRVLTEPDPDADVRWTAARSLGKMGPSVGEPAIAALVRVLTEPDPDAKVRSAAVEAFWRMAPDVGAPAIAALVKVLTEPDPDADVRNIAARALCEVGPDVGEPAVAALVRVLTKPDPDAKVRSTAACSLGQIGPSVGEPAIAALVRVLTEPDPDVDVRSTAVEALGKMGPGVGKPTMAALVRMITQPDPDARVRIIAAQVLWQVGSDVGEPEIAALVRVLTEPDCDDQMCGPAAAALAGLTIEGLPFD